MSDEVFTKRGIDPKIAKARPYVQWTKDDTEPVRDAYADIRPGQLRWMLGLAKQSDGLVITRYAPPGLSLDHVYAELRPDTAVVTRTYWDFHPTVLPNELPLIPGTTKRISRKNVHTAAEVTKHIARKRNEDRPDLHGGANDEELHRHQKKARYIFPPSGLKWETWFHVHDEIYADDPEGRKEHCQAFHEGSDPAEEHRHGRWVKDTDDPRAKRIDVHPFAASKIETSTRLFFGIEGCLKADSMLSAGEAVFSVPSVTLWDAPELPEFAAMYLAGKTVFIVPDADFAEKPEVLTQALLCRTWLQRHGIDAHVATPPAREGMTKCECDSPHIDEEGFCAMCGGYLKGVDDFRGAGGDLDDLVVHNLQVPYSALLRWIRWQAIECGVRHDRIERNASVLQGLIVHGGASGKFAATPGKLARVMGVAAKSVSRAIKDLKETGVISVEGSSELTQKRIRDSRHGFWTSQWDWEDGPPEITIELPELRALKMPDTRVGDIRPGQGLAPDYVSNNGNPDELVRVLWSVGLSQRSIVTVTGYSIDKVKRITRGASRTPVAVPSKYDPLTQLAVRRLLANVRWDESTDDESDETSAEV